MYNQKSNSIRKALQSEEYFNQKSSTIKQASQSEKQQNKKSTVKVINHQTG